MTDPNKLKSNPTNILNSITWVKWRELDFLSDNFKVAILRYTDEDLMDSFDISTPLAMSALKMDFKDIPKHINDENGHHNPMFQGLLNLRLKEGR